MYDAYKYINWDKILEERKSGIIKYIEEGNLTEDDLDKLSDVLEDL